LRKKKCIFLDRDGTLIKAIIKENTNSFKLRPPYCISEFKLYKDINLLNTFSKDYLLIVISNQPDLVNGLQTKNFHQFINSQIKKYLKINEFAFCQCLESNPNCKCYKPKTQMIKKIISKFNISIPQSFLIGDTWRDIKMANNINLKSILIDRGYFKELKQDFLVNKAKPNFFINNLNQVKNIIK